MRPLLAILAALALLPAATADVPAPVPAIGSEGDTIVVGARWCPVLVTDGEAEPCGPAEAWATTNTTNPADTHVVIAFCVWGESSITGIFEVCTPYV